MMEFQISLADWLRIQAFAVKCGYSTTNRIYFLDVITIVFNTPLSLNLRLSVPVVSVNLHGGPSTL